MRRALLWCLLAVVAAPVLAADLPDLGGTWVLNVRKSQWGKMRKPISCIVSVSHNQLSITYTGTITYANEESRDFGFVGAIDGAEYPSVTGFGRGKMSLRRVGFDRVSSTFRSDDGEWVETARTVLSRDGSVMTRHMQVRGPAGEQSWIEVYERR